VFNVTILGYSFLEGRGMAVDTIFLPDFTCLTHSGDVFDFHAWSGKYLILYFYPKDNTPGCTKEAQDFTQHYQQFCALGAVIIGISSDTAVSHQKFIDHYAIPYALLVDTDKKLANHFGVYIEKSMYGRRYLGINRSTFIFSAKGDLLQQWLGVKVKGHVIEVLDFIDQVSQS
jgi:thioredoxin-dependent peroxiredoxin